MVVKGIISEIDREAMTASVILPEYGDIVTKPLRAYRTDIWSSLQVNDFVMVIVFNDDFNDCMIV